MEIIFDMETGDPDDLITLLMLVNNPNIDLKAVTCYQGSHVQIGLIYHVLSLAGLETIVPIGGLNSEEPSVLSQYYYDVVGSWPSKSAEISPSELIKQTLDTYPNTYILTGAPLTNIAQFVHDYPDTVIKNMVTQGGYIGDLVEPSKKLKKFINKPSQRTYNLGNDTDAFNTVNNAQSIENLTFVTKDLCHGFMYDKTIHNTINFNNDAISQLLHSCLSHYTNQNKSKAMHDPLAMLYMLRNDLGKTLPINMNYSINEKNHPVFSSRVDNMSTRKSLIDYSSLDMWNEFKKLCENTNYQNTIKVKKKN